MWSNSQQVDGHHGPAAQPKSTALLQELLQLWGTQLPMRGAGERAKGELDPTVHGKRQDSCSHSLWECWGCTEGAQAEEHREPGPQVHPAGEAAARSSDHKSNAGGTGDFHVLLTITQIKSKQLKTIW